MSRPRQFVWRFTVAAYTVGGAWSSSVTARTLVQAQAAAASYRGDGLRAMILSAGTVPPESIPAEVDVSAWRTPRGLLA